MVERVRPQDQLQPTFSNSLPGALIHMCRPGNFFAQTSGTEPGGKPPGTPPPQPRPGPIGRPT